MKKDRGNKLACSAVAVFLVGGLNRLRFSRDSARLVLFCLLGGTMPSVLAAGSLSYTGVFTEDDNSAVFSFSLPSQEDVTLRTWSYAGGINLGGATIASGGFDPLLTVFDSSGNWQGANNDGTGTVAADAATGNAFDAFLSLNLAPGSYQAYLTESDNTAVGASLSDGFTQSGQGNFSCPEFIGIEGSFCDATPAFRNGNYAVDIQYADAPASSPEPATGVTFILLTVAAGLAHLKRRFRRS